MSDLIAADLMIQEGVDEFRLAAAKTAQGIIEQGLAVLKIKQGCEVKQGGTDFPEVAMRLLGLTKGAASEYCTIGSRAKELFAVANSLPVDSRTTLYQIARMDEATIADKIARGCITPTATRAKVLEQVRVTTERNMTPELAALDQVGSAEDVQEVFAQLKPRQQAILEKHMEKTVNEIRNTIQADYNSKLDERRTKMKDEEHRFMDMRSELEKRLLVVKTPFTKVEYKFISGMLASDKHQDEMLKKRADKAAIMFRKIEPFCRREKFTRKVTAAFEAA